MPAAIKMDSASLALNIELRMDFEMEHFHANRETYVAPRLHNFASSKQ